MQVLTDPRTTVAQCLNVIVTAELTDNAGWDLLVSLAEQAGEDDLAAQFRQALAREAEHLAKVQRWLRLKVLEQAT